MPQRPALPAGRHARHLDRITKRKGAAIARCGDIDPDYGIGFRQEPQIRPQAPGIRQEADHGHHLPQGQKRKRRTARRQTRAQEIGQGRDRKMRPRGLAHDQNLVAGVPQGLGNVVAKPGQPLFHRR